jgi:hypothetical protein
MFLRVRLIGKMAASGETSGRPEGSSVGSGPQHAQKTEGTGCRAGAFWWSRMLPEPQAAVFVRSPLGQHKSEAWSVLAVGGRGDVVTI